MKPSHLKTPHTLDECHFSMNADPIYRPEEERMDWQDKLVLWASVVTAVVLVVIVWTS